MEIHLNRSSQTPLYLQISNTIKNEILKNEIFEGYKLPSERSLAKQLNVHRNTIIKAYEQLIADGLVIASRSAPCGYFVYRQQYNTKSRTHFSFLEKEIKYQFDAASNTFGDMYEESKSDAYISLGGMLLNEEAFPKAEVTAFLEEHLQALPAMFYEYCSPMGNETLRENICTILSRFKIDAGIKNIQIVSETCQALNYIAKVYLTRGDVIVAEEPISPEVMNLFVNLGIRVVTVPMQDDGMDLALLEEALIKHQPKFIYTLPTYHIPTGITMSFEKRKQLLQYAYQYNVPIIEEDSQRELFYQPPFPSLYAMDDRKQVIYVDSFIFTFLPGAMIGYMVAPTDLVETVSKLVRMEQIVLSGICQHLVSAFFTSGHYDRHTQFLRSHYQKKRDLLCAQLQHLVPLGLEFTPSDGGLFVWCKLPPYANERTLYRQAKARNVLVVPGYLFFPNGNQGDGYLRLCFSNISDENIVKSVGILKEILESQVPPTPST